MAYNTMTKIATYTVGASSVPSITISNIPQTYTDLVIKISASTNLAANWCDIAITPNGSILTNNTFEITVYSLGTSVGTNNGVEFQSGFGTGTSNTASTFGNSEVTIYNYTSSNAKTGNAFGASEGKQASTLTNISASNWNSTAPITSLTFTPQTGASFLQYSEITIYGVSNANNYLSAPTIASVSDLGGGTASVSMSSPAVIPYTVTSNNGQTATGIPPVQVPGLSVGSAYTFTAQAVTPFGTSGPSTASSSFTPYNGYTALQTVTVTTNGTASVSFGAIPQNYTHLQIRSVSRSNNVAYYDAYYLTNFDGAATSANAAYHYMYGTGSSIGYGQGTAAYSAQLGYIPANNIASNIFAAGIIDIPDYSNTTKIKTLKSMVGWDDNGGSSGQVYVTYAGALAYGLGTNAVTNIQISVNNSFAIGSKFTLYGIK
jgi:hypothetical protein